MKKTILSIALFSLSLSFVGGVQTSFAADSAAPVSTANTAQYTLLTPLPCVPKNSPGCNSAGLLEQVTIQDYVLYVFKLAIALAVFLAVVVVTFAGFKYMTEESITGKGAAREMIQNAVLGLLGALGSWLILYTINPQLVDLSLITAPKLHLTASSTILTTASLQSTINSENNTLIQGAINQNTNAAAAQQTAQNNLNTLNASLKENLCIDENGNDIAIGDPTCDDLWTQYQASNDSLDTAVSQQKLQTAVANMTTAQQAFTANSSYTTNYSLNPFSYTNNTAPIGNTSITDAKNAIQNVETIYQKAAATLANDDPNQLLLTQQRTYAEASIVNGYNTNVAVQNLAKDVATGIPKLAQSDITTAQTLVTTLQSSSIPNVNTSNGLITNGIQTSLSSNPDLQNAYQSNNAILVKELQTAITNAQKMK